MPVKGLTAEQLFDSLCQATGYRENTNIQQRIFGFGTSRSTFLEKFTDQEKKTEYHTSIPQALTMMNNQLIANATSVERGRVLGAIADSSFMSTRGKVEGLFLAALARKPTKPELDKFVAYVEPRRSVGQREKGARRSVLGAAQQHGIFVQPLIVDSPSHPPFRLAATRSGGTLPRFASRLNERGPGGRAYKEHPCPHPFCPVVSG